MHWRLVPVDLQKAVWAAYVVGQELRKDPSPAYLEAAAAAVDAIEKHRGGAMARAIAECDLVHSENGALAGPLFAREGKE